MAGNKKMEVGDVELRDPFGGAEMRHQSGPGMSLSPNLVPSPSCHSQIWEQRAGDGWGHGQVSPLVTWQGHRATGITPEKTKNGPCFPLGTPHKSPGSSPKSQLPPEPQE